MSRGKFFLFRKLLVFFGSGCEYMLMLTRSWIGRSVIQSMLVHLFELQKGCRMLFCRLRKSLELARCGRFVSVGNLAYLGYPCKFESRYGHKRCQKFSEQ